MLALVKLSNRKLVMVTVVMVECWCVYTMTPDKFWKPSVTYLSCFGVQLESLKCFLLTGGLVALTVGLEGRKGVDSGGRNKEEGKKQGSLNTQDGRASEWKHSEWARRGTAVQH